MSTLDRINSLRLFYGLMLANANCLKHQTRWNGERFAFISQTPVHDIIDGLDKLAGIRTYGFVGTRLALHETFAKGDAKPPGCPCCGG